MITRIEMALIYVLFGLLIPVVLFLNAYPGGAREFYYRSTYQLTKPHITTTLDIVLYNRFSVYDFSEILDVGFISTADANTQVNILVKDNMGGDADLLFALQDAMKSSKAYIVVTVEHFGLSCGTYILNHGNILVLPNDALLLFHTGDYVVNGQPTTTTIDNIKTDPADKAAYEQVVKEMAPYQGWITAGEYEKWKHGTDIWVTGADICKGKLGRHADVLFHTSDGCVIRGDK